MMTSMIQNDTNDNEYAVADNDEYDDNDDDDQSRFVYHLRRRR